MESDSVVAIQVVTGKSILLKNICNVIEDIDMLAKKTDNIKYLFCRSVNILTYKIVKVNIFTCPL